MTSSKPSQLQLDKIPESSQQLQNITCEIWNQIMNSTIQWHH